MADKPKRITDIGAPHFSKFLHPVIAKNYGKWKYHEIINKGAMKHVSETGDELYTVRMASPRLVSSDFIREICDIADKFSEGHLRFTTPEASVAGVWQWIQPWVCTTLLMP